MDVTPISWRRGEGEDKKREGKEGRERGYGREREGNWPHKGEIGLS